MNRWKRIGLAGALVAGLAACDDPVGLADEIAGEYELAATVENQVRMPVGPTDQGALLVLRPDRTWVLIRHDAGRTPTTDAFGLADRYTFEADSALSLFMFSEAPALQFLEGAASVDGDTLRWGREIFVRR